MYVCVCSLQMMRSKGQILSRAVVEKARHASELFLSRLVLGFVLAGVLLYIGAHLLNDAAEALATARQRKYDACAVVATEELRGNPFALVDAATAACHQNVVAYAVEEFFRIQVFHFFSWQTLWGTLVCAALCAGARVVWPGVARAYAERRLHAFIGSGVRGMQELETPRWSALDAEEFQSMPSAAAGHRIEHDKRW